jgi:hypothetical protein
MWEPQHLTTLWVSTAYYRDSVTFLLRERTYEKVLQNLYSSPNIVRMVKSRRIRWTGHTVYFGKI